MVAMSAAWPRSSWDGAQIARGLEEMAREGMPEHMGMNALVEPLTDPPFVHALLHRAFLQAGALCTHREPGPHRFDGIAPHRDDAPLLALTGHPHLAFDQIEVGEVEPYGLRDPQPRGVDELQEGAVADGQIIGPRDGHEVCRLVHVQYLREPLDLIYYEGNSLGWF
jgi:hypothetical protein